ncbi:sugar nucleotidyltransferase (plasmid) [Natrialba magadii ATCC 43099]|uniref:Nucleotidyltransferase n=1 Tax=Natrialba magadii (strain ATCC 43099 / DSM 3394 / CCM 3739 / CIP 104546 / IAM 13178 / JCM 8861 / NBRC 102185 / NCIMB 2190 / MS3) TaxID=547559 RepID=D3T1B2_NATMM|nr:NDP-sugar synthase [Natrialba magadii]ADD07371.1 sugar nucleotidyltransferase [Natrialba magadii ATCC 43099]ELY32441.1 nucleotidyltransferase [Natrialba magadii ATCC 43099]
MKAVVLAGGYATRLWPITRHRPKMFLPLEETTVIERIYAELETADRIEEVYVSTNERFAPEFEAQLADSDYEKPQLSVEETRAEDEKLGVVGALAQLVDREGIDDDLLVIAGDNIVDFAIEDFLAYYDRKDAPVIAAYDVGSPERATAYGVVDLEDDRVVDFQEKPDDPPGTRVSIGCYAFPQDALELLPTYLEGGNDPDEPGWFVQWLQSREPTYAYVFDGAWFDIGTRESYLDAVAWFLDGGTRVADSATLENAMLGSNVHVMANATLVDTDVERSVIFPDVTVEGTTIRRSIVDEGAALEGVDLHDAMIGAYTQIPDAPDAPGE